MLTQTTNIQDIVEPVELDEIKELLNIEFDEKDAALTRLMPQAREIAESYINRIIADRSYAWVFDEFETAMELPLYPVRSDSVTVSYVDEQDATQSFTDFSVIDDGVKAVIVPNKNSDWPDVKEAYNVITVSFEAGYAAAKGSVPELIKHAIVRILATIFDQPEDHTAGVALNTVPLSASVMLRPFRRDLV